MALLIVAIAATTSAAAVANAEATAAPRAGAPWGSLATSRIYSVGWLSDGGNDDPDVRGPAILYGVRDEAGHCNCQVEAWLAVQSGEGQRVVGVGGEATRLLGFGRGPVRFGPRISLGLEHRRRNPDMGLAGFLGVGLEAGVWLGKHQQIVVTFDREFGFPGESRNQLGFLFRLARPYDPASKETPPSEAKGEEDSSGRR